MANYYGTTASTGAKIKEGKEDELRAYLEKWSTAQEEDTVKIESGWLRIYGYDDFSACPVADEERAKEDEYLEVGDADWDNADPVAFLEGLAPFLEVSGKEHKTNKEFIIVVQTVGSEKCRFPLGACEYVLYADGKVTWNTFKH